MLQDVPVKITRGPVRDVDGAMVRALRRDLGLSLMEFGAELGKEKGTVYRWELGGIDEVMWRGVLSFFSRPPEWRPSAASLAAAEGEVADLRQAAKARAAGKPTKKKPRPKAH
jgi:hypothetical protein